MPSACCSAMSMASSILESGQPKKSRLRVAHALSGTFKISATISPSRFGPVYLQISIAADSKPSLGIACSVVPRADALLRLDFSSFAYLLQKRSFNNRNVRHHTVGRGVPTRLNVQMTGPLLEGLTCDGCPPRSSANKTAIPERQVGKALKHVYFRPRIGWRQINCDVDNRVIVALWQHEVAQQQPTATAIDKVLPVPAALIQIFLVFFQQSEFTTRSCLHLAIVDLSQSQPKLFDPQKGQIDRIGHRDLEFRLTPTLQDRNPSSARIKTGLCQGIFNHNDRRVSVNNTPCTLSLQDGWRETSRLRPLPDRRTASSLAFSLSDASARSGKRVSSSGIRAMSRIRATEIVDAPQLSPCLITMKF